MNNFVNSEGGVKIRWNAKQVWDQDCKGSKIMCLGFCRDFRTWYYVRREKRRGRLEINFESNNPVIDRLSNTSRIIRAPDTNT